ncbi:MAG: DNA recombination protein RmuC, partial [Phormidesmis sp.]
MIVCVSKIVRVGEQRLGNLLLGGLLGGAVGTMLGATAMWWALTTKLQAVREKTKNDLIADRASMVEQLRGKDERLEDLRRELKERDRTLSTYQDRLTQAATQRATAEAKLQDAQQQTSEKIDLLSAVQQQFTDAFKALSSQALQANNQSFLELAETRLSEFQTAAKGDLALKQQAVEEVVKPLQTSLSNVETFLLAVEGQRVSAYAQLTEQISALASSQVQLQAETANLAKALRSPTVRGRWGEIQLKRVVEIAGMSEHCDFTQQVTNTDVGLRPDMLVQLPGQRQIVVDAKAPLSSYLASLEASNET